MPTRLRSRVKFVRRPAASGPMTMPIVRHLKLLQRIKGKADRPPADGWSKVRHFEASSMARVNYSFHSEYVTRSGDDAHRVVAILTIDYSSH